MVSAARRVARPHLLLHEKSELACRFSDRTIVV
jgi:hypothetical protein